MMIQRRQFLIGFAAAPFLSRIAEAQGFGQQYALRSDAGDLIPNFRIPASLDPALLRGIIWAGNPAADVTIFEFFDYRCPFCRTAAPELDALLASDPDLRLALVNNAILSPDSVEAAKVQQAVLKHHGDAVAYSLHKRLFEQRGTIDAARSLQLASDLGLDTAPLRREVEGTQVGDVVARQMKLAANLGLSTTPSFVMDGVGMLGWPGIMTMRRMIAAIRACDRPVCASTKG